MSEVTNLKHLIESNHDESFKPQREEIYQLLQDHLSEDETLEILWLIHWLYLLKKNKLMELNQRAREYQKQKTQTLKTIRENKTLETMVLNLIDRAGYEIKGNLEGLLEALLMEAYPLSSVYELIELPRDGRGRPTHPHEDELTYKLHSILDPYFGERKPYHTYEIIGPYEIICKICIAFLDDRDKTDKAVRDSVKRGAKLVST